MKPLTLAIIQVGDREDSTAFIRAKQSFAKKIGVGEKHIHLSVDISETGLLETIKECNLDNGINGIIVQLPLPEHLDRSRILSAIDPAKDADALTPRRIESWLAGEKDAIFPATARGVREILDFYNIDIAGKRVVIIGRSMLVGKPLAMMCLARQATVIICHSKTPDLKKETLNADVIISAVGKPGLIKSEHVRKGAIIIDVGITRTSHGKLAGDVDFESVSKVASSITPVPGGVGQMTVLALFENLCDMATK